MTRTGLSETAVQREGYSRQHKSRLENLTCAEILNAPDEPNFDAITRLAAEYFHADTVLLGFADEDRVWIKSHWGEPVREFPRPDSIVDSIADSIFDLVLAADGPIIVPDTAVDNRFHAKTVMLGRIQAASFASAPIRGSSGNILGCLTIFGAQPRRPMGADELRMLESLAEMVSGQLELRRLRRMVQNHGSKHNSRRQNPPQNSRVPGQRPELHRALRRALDQRQFVLYYQPEIELSTRRIAGLEALIRWRHPDRGLVSPMEFIPYAEESGMILPIGDWGLAEACGQIQKWCDEDLCHPSLRVCVNLSARQFAREGLADHVEELLRRFGISSRQLGLEMTESSLIPDAHTAMEVLGNLRRLGVSLLMDDFGTGYSSLNHLHKFPFDVLKIDRSFVARMTEGDQALQIVRTIIELARVLGMNVVAEGIENLAQYELLQQLGCRYGQGYLFAKPMPPEEVGRLLRLPGRILPNPPAALAN
jgi:EAL domain-containing protein (putative c-di-GMP-specific phosphodiesterase class I)